MNLIIEKITKKNPQKDPPQKLTQEMLKGLCFNCDHRKNCSWKENRKYFCEHFK